MTPNPDATSSLACRPCASDEETCEASESSFQEAATNHVLNTLDGDAFMLCQFIARRQGEAVSVPAWSLQLRFLGQDVPELFSDSAGNVPFISDTGLPYASHWYFVVTFPSDQSGLQVPLVVAGVSVAFLTSAAGK